MNRKCDLWWLAVCSKQCNDITAELMAIVCAHKPLVLLTCFMPVHYKHYTAQTFAVMCHSCTVHFALL